MTKNSILRTAVYIPMITITLWLASGILNPKEKAGSWIWPIAIAAGLILSYTITRTSTSTKRNLFSAILGTILAAILWVVALLITFGVGPN